MMIEGNAGGDGFHHIIENKTWSLEDMPPGHRAIGLKWVFKLKRNEEEEIVKYKARLVKKG